MRAAATAVAFSSEACRRRRRRNKWAPKQAPTQSAERATATGNMGLIAAAVGGALGGNEGDMVVIVMTGGVTLSTMLLSATVSPLALVILIGEDGRAAIDVVTFATTAAVIIISVTRTAYTCCANALAWSLLPFTGLTSTKQLGGAQLSAAAMPWARFTGLMPATAVSANTRDVVWGLEGGGGDGEGGGGDGDVEGGGEGGSEGGNEGGGEGGREGDGGEVRRSAPAARRTALRPRHLAASLEERVLPRLAFHDALRRRALGSQSAGAEAMAAEVRLTLSSVTVVSDASFAKFVGAKPDEYANFRRELLARKRPTGLKIDWLPEDFDLTPLVSPELEKPRCIERCE